MEMPRVFHLLTAYSAGGGSATGLLIKEECEGGRQREKRKYSNWKLYQGLGKIIENLHAVVERGRGAVGQGVNPF